MGSSALMRLNKVDRSKVCLSQGAQSGGYAGGRVGPLSLPEQSQEVSGLRSASKPAAGLGVVTEGKSGVQANSGKESAKRFLDAGVMTGCYSAPCQWQLKTAHFPRKIASGFAVIAA